MISISVFEPTGTEVRSFIEPSTNVCWFHAGGVGETLEFSNPYRYLPSVLMDSEYKEVSIGAGRPSIYIREEGVYKLIMRSKSSFAESFQHWLAYDVLPEIRKKGHFGNVPNSQSDGSEFWNLIDGAIARGMDKGEVIDLHRRFKGHQNHRSTQIQFFAKERYYQRILELSKRLGTIKAKDVLMRLSSQQRSNINADIVRQWFCELADRGAGTIAGTNRNTTFTAS